MVGREAVLAGKSEPCAELGALAWGCSPGLGAGNLSGARGRDEATTRVAGRATMAAPLGSYPPVLIIACRIPSRRT